MRFFEVLLSGAALVAAALAVPTIDNYPSSLKAGQSIEVIYSPKDNAPTTILLRKGPSGNLATVATLTATAVGGIAKVTIPSGLTNGNDYAFQIVRADGINYSAQIPLSGGEAAHSSSSSAGYSTSSASSHASSSSTSSSSTKTTASSTITSSVGSVSGAPTHIGHNSTITSATLSHTSTAGPSATSTSTPPESANGAGFLESSPIALFFGVVAALAYLN